MAKSNRIKKRRRARMTYRVTHFITTRVDRARYWLRTLSAKQRALTFGASALALCGAIALIIVLSTNKNEAEPAVLDQVMLPESAAAGGEDVDALTVGFSIEDEPEKNPEPTPSPTPDPTLLKGMTGEEVEQLQIRLMELNYLDIDEPTQYFGPATQDAVRRFQRQHKEDGLQMDGIAGLATLELLYSDSAKKYTLLYDTEGTDVENFQRQLKELGYLSKVTGFYGDETVAAVKAFQARNGLREDGKAGEKTFDLINSDSAKPSATLEKKERTRASVNKMISTAQSQIGKKYILGNEGPNSFDCSGLVYYCLKQAGSNRRRLNAAGYSQVSDWTKITSYSKLEKGDLLFFYNNGKTKVGHVGIYIGSGMMIDASSNNGKVVKRSCTTSYWKSHFVCARRPW